MTSNILIRKEKQKFSKQGGEWTTEKKKKKSPKPRLERDKQR